MGFFGPIGVGAIFYLSISQEYLRTEVLDDNGIEREDAARLREIMTVVIWFLVVCSIVSLFRLSACFLGVKFADENQIVHGLTIGLVKLGIQVPRTLRTGNAVETTRAPRHDAIPESAV